MLLRLIILFIGVPILELMLLHKLSQGSTTLFGLTLVLIVATGAIGAILARRQGLRVWQRVSKRMMSGESPALEMVEGLLIFSSGLLLITPGLITDATGFLLLIPSCRRWIAGYLLKRIKDRAFVQVQSFGTFGRQVPTDDDIIDAEFTRKDASETPPINGPVQKPVEDAP